MTYEEVIAPLRALIGPRTCASGHPIELIGVTETMLFRRAIRLGCTKCPVNLCRWVEVEASISLGNETLMALALEMLDDGSGL